MSDDHGGSESQKYPASRQAYLQELMRGALRDLLDYHYLSREYLVEYHWQYRPILELSRHLKEDDPRNSDIEYITGVATHIKDHLLEFESIARNRLLLDGLQVYIELINGAENADIRMSEWLADQDHPQRIRISLYDVLSTRDHIETPPSASPPIIINEIVNVGSYLGMAGIAGVIGNRADAAFTIAARKLFRSVHRRWKRRVHGDAFSLTREEAIDAAKAAAIALKYIPDSIIIEFAEPVIHGKDKGWVIELQATHKTLTTNLLHAYVPAGDPKAAKILIRR